MKTEKTKVQPKPVVRINCPKCGELQIKIYPYSSIKLAEGSEIPPCQKCINTQKVMPAQGSFGYR